MASPPAVVIVAEIGERGEEPGGNFCVGPKPCALLMEPHERLGDEVMRVGPVLHIAPGEGEQRPLPAGDQLVERGIPPLL